MGLNEGRQRGKFRCVHTQKKRQLEKSHILNSIVYLKDLEKQEQTIFQISILEEIIKIRIENNEDEKSI